MKLEVLKLNFRILRLYGLMYNPNSRLCRTVSLCFMVLSVLNLLAHVVELCRVTNSPFLLMEGILMAILFTKCLTKVTTFRNFEAQYKSLFKTMEEDLGMARIS